MVTPLQKCYDEISILKEELKKRDEQIKKLIENNTNLNKKVESLLFKSPKQKFMTTPKSKVAKFVENYEKRPALRSKVAKFVENYEKNIDKPRTIKKPPIIPEEIVKTPPIIPKTRPALRSKVAKFVENYEKNIDKPRTIKKPPIIPEEIVKTPPIIPKTRPALRSKVAKFVENYEKNIDKPRTIKKPPIIPEEIVKTPPIIPKTRPALRSKVAKFVENYEKNIDKPRTIKKPPIIPEEIVKTPPIIPKTRPALRSKVAKFVENYEKNIDKPRTIKKPPIIPEEIVKTPPIIPKTRPALRSKVAKFVENYEKNIDKPRTIKKPPIIPEEIVKTPPIPKPRTIKKPPIIPEEIVKTPPIPKPSDYTFIDEIKPELIKSAFKKIQKRFKIISTYVNSPVDEMESKKNIIKNLLEDNLKKMNSFKFNYGLEITFTKLVKENLSKINEIKETLWSIPQIIINESDIDKKIDLAISDIFHKITIFSSSTSSTLVISEINSQYIDIIQYKPLKGSSYIELPNELKNPKMGLINIKNKDHKCFTYCLLYHLHQKKIKTNPQRVSNYKQYENTVDFTGINFPVSINDIPKIEKMNNISINVFGYENKSTFPIFISDSQNENPLNLLLISNNNKRHYIYIKDFNRFMYKKTKHHCKKHFCISCLQCFSTEAILNNHIENCLLINKKQNIIMPKFGSKVFF